jgi:hypothetical protein
MLKALATDLYRAQQKVHRLQEQLENAPLADVEALTQELRGAAAECNQLRRLMEAKKQQPLHTVSRKKSG